MARKSFVLLVTGIVIFFLCSISSADVPHMINYQGKLTTATGGCLNDTVSMTFTIYSDSLGTSDEWSETQDEVVVKEGIFSVLLGSVDSIPALVFDGSTKYLGVQVESDPEMRPLKPMVSVAYAYRSRIADGAGGWVDDGTAVRLEDSTDLVGIGAAPPSDAKLYVKTDSVVGTSAVYAVGGMGVKGISTAYAGTGMSGEGGHAGVAGYGGYIGILGQGYYGGYFEGKGCFTGDVGIGTPSPQAKLEVAADFGHIDLTETDHSYKTWRLQVNGGVFKLYEVSADENRISVAENTGYVGIGTIDPTTLLTTKLSDSDTTWAGTTTQYAVEIDNVDQTDSNWAQIVFDDNDGGTNPAGFIGTRFTDHTNNYGELHFGTRGSGSVGSRMVIDSPGNVGIGTTSPVYKLDVEGYVQAHGYYTGDIVFQKDKQKLWRMFEDEDGLYLENLKTGKIYRFVLQEVKKE